MKYKQRITQGGRESMWVSCYYCPEQVRRRDAKQADEFNGGQGGWVCPVCIECSCELATDRDLTMKNKQRTVT